MSLQQQQHNTERDHKMTTSRALSFCLLHELYIFPTDLVQRNIRQWWKRNCSSKASLCIQDAKNSQWENLDITVSNDRLRSRKEILLFFLDQEVESKL